MPPQVTALQIAALKRLSRGNRLLLLDRNGGGAAKAVARALAERGFGRVYVIKGGFQGWQVCERVAARCLPAARSSMG